METIKRLCWRLIPAIILAFVSIFWLTSFSLAAVKDTDADALSDEAEETIYHTDPTVFDTDGDGIGDAEEVLGGTDPTDAGDSEFEQLKLSDPGIFGERDKFAWYFARATGILSFILLSLTVIFGLVISSRAFMRKILPANALEFHRTLSWLALFSVILHAASFLFDDFLRMTVAEIFVPFLLDRDFKTTLGFDIGKTTALGIIAIYLILLLILTSEFRAKMSAKLWRRLHYFSFVAYPLFVAHGVMSGTDSTEWWMQAIYITSVTAVMSLIVTRVIFRNILPKIRARKAAAAVASAGNDSDNHPQ